jgi:hypothetical protein
MLGPCFERAQGSSSCDCDVRYSAFRAHRAQPLNFLQAFPLALLPTRRPLPDAPFGTRSLTLHLRRIVTAFAKNPVRAGLAE